MSASVSFILPTLRRATFLRKSLAAIASQTIPATQVLVGVRADDDESRDVVAEFVGGLPVRVIEVRGIGVIGSMSACLAETKEDFVALVDDDVELPPHWVTTMLDHLATHPEVLGVAGRDFLQDDVHLRANEAKTLDVGRFHWCGKISGNHHLGTGPARQVDILRGSNCLFHGNFLRAVGFESRLRGKGAQVNWELALALHARCQGKTLFYDPNVEVIHHTAPRHDADQLHRGKFNAEALHDMFYNESFVLNAYGPLSMRLRTMAWTFLVGGGHAPGLIKALQMLCRRQPHLVQRYVAFVSGWLDGLRDAKNHRRAIRYRRSSVSASAPGTA